jgi:hypothetical protein
MDIERRTRSLQFEPPIDDDTIEQPEVMMTWHQPNDLASTNRLMGKIAALFIWA